VGFPTVSEKLAELPRRKTGVLDNPTHRERVHGIMPWDGHDPPAVGHDDVLALSRDLKASLFKRSDSPKVGNPRYLRHALRRDFHFPQVLPARQFFSDFEVFANGVLNVRQRFLFRRALRPAPGETGARDAVPLFSSYQSN